MRKPTALAEFTRAVYAPVDAEFRLLEVRRMIASALGYDPLSMEVHLHARSAVWDEAEHMICLHEHIL